MRGIVTWRRRTRRWSRVPEGSRRGRRVVPALILVLILALAGAGEARAQIAAADTVTAVRVAGNVTVDGDLVLRAFAVPVGSRYSTDAVRRGIRRLYDLGFFSDIAVERDPDQPGMSLIVRVRENPRVASVEFAGNDEIDDDDLLAATGSLVGRMADDRLLARVKRRVEAAYERKGYSRARATPRYLAGDSESRRILLVEVEEGPKVRVEKIRFEGLHQLEPGDLKGAMEQGTTGFLRGGVYKPEQLEGDPQRIEAEMAKRGFRDGKVLGYEIEPGSKDDRVVIRFQVEEGPRYTVGAVKWEGQETVTSRALYDLTDIESGDVFNQEKIDKTLEEAYGLYAEYGYIYLSIRPDFTVADSTVDVTFAVREGEPSHIHDIIIQGNTRTKERVVRRTLAIRPGDLFRRNALVRSQRELQQLGYFSDMKVDSRPVAGSNDIDLIFDVEERQVGTASAGFGFSSSVGLTGFMELGHTNLFGNGQSLNLRMERGSRRNNAELSFTEPWFLGTPTSLGVDLFSTNRIYRGSGIDLEIRRAGGAIRVGRPLPLAYTRLFVSYGLENQSVVDETNDTDLVDYFVTGFRVDQKNSLSSNLAFTLVRNSTDHPIYPTVGSNTRLRTEFAGGFLGGDQVFQKYELDMSRYLHTINLGGWKPILMLRSRVGAIGEAFRDFPLIPQSYRIDEDIPAGAVADSVAFGFASNVPIPVPRHYKEYVPETNELFRLGGTTFNQLRGYDDFEIVPEENVGTRFLIQRQITAASDSTVADTTYTVGASRAYYPGGKYMFVGTAEWQFTIADPLHGLFFAEVGGTWNDLQDFRFDRLHRGVGFGIRMEVPLLGLIGFDYGYGFDRLNEATGRYDEKGWQPHIQFGRIF